MPPLLLYTRPFKVLQYGGKFQMKLIPFTLNDRLQVHSFLIFHIVNVNINRIPLRRAYLSNLYPFLRYPALIPYDSISEILSPTTAKKHRLTCPHQPINGHNSKSGTSSRQSQSLDEDCSTCTDYHGVFVTLRTCSSVSSSKSSAEGRESTGRCRAETKSGLSSFQWFRLVGFDRTLEGARVSRGTFVFKLFWKIYCEPIQSHHELYSFCWWVFFVGKVFPMLFLWWFFVFVFDWKSFPSFE